MKRTMTFREWYEQFGELAVLAKKVKFNNRTWTVTQIDSIKNRIVLEE